MSFGLFFCISCPCWNQSQPQGSLQMPMESRSSGPFPKAFSPAASNVSQPVRSLSLKNVWVCDLGGQVMKWSKWAVPCIPCLTDYSTSWNSPNSYWQFRTWERARPWLKCLSAYFNSMSSDLHQTLPNIPSDFPASLITWWGTFPHPFHYKRSL